MDEVRNQRQRQRQRPGALDIETMQGHPATHSSNPARHDLERLVHDAMGASSSELRLAQANGFASNLRMGSCLGEPMYLALES